MPLIRVSQGPPPCTATLSAALAHAKVCRAPRPPPAPRSSRPSWNGPTARFRKKRAGAARTSSSAPGTGLPRIQRAGAQNVCVREARLQCVPPPPARRCLQPAEVERADESALRALQAHHFLVSGVKHIICPVQVAQNSATANTSVNAAVPIRWPAWNVGRAAPTQPPVKKVCGRPPPPSPCPCQTPCPVTPNPSLNRRRAPAAH